MNNEYGRPPQAPLTFVADAESVIRASSELCHSMRQVLDKLESTVSPANATFGNVLKVLLQHENEIQLTSGPISMCALTTTDLELRRAAVEASNKISHFLIDCKASMNTFRLVDAVYQQQERVNELDTESRKALVEERRTFIRRGVGLSAADPSGSGDGRLVTEIAQRLQSIESEFLKNLDEEKHSIWLTRHDLAGIPKDVVSDLETSAGEHDGNLRFYLNDPKVRWMISVTSVSATRERIYLESRRVAKENLPLFEKAIQLRHRSAQILGYPNHTAYKVEVTMAKTPAAVMHLLDTVRDRVVQRLPEDIQKLLELKNDDLTTQGRRNVDFILWSDVAYYSRMYEEKHYSVNHTLIAEYFPLSQTVSKMLSLFGKLFGFVFMELTNTNCHPSALEQNLIWHPDVMLYSVWNDEQEGSGFTGYLYLDLYPRPGKSGGIQCRPLHLGFERSDGGRHYPSTVLLANFSRPTAVKPSLLQHSEVVILFHELGHGIHDLSGRCKYSRFHGAETVGDFNEAPSQMLENWCWEAVALKQLSGHYQTEAPITDPMTESLIRTRVVLPALKLLPQLKMTIFDIAVHSAVGSEASSIDIAKIYSDCNELGGIKSVGEEYGYASYRHLFSGSDAGMYSYLWSKVIAMDMFEAVFKKDPLDDESGRRYRHTVLEKGGSQDEMLTLVQFLGREPTTEAFFKSLGLD